MTISDAATTAAGEAADTLRPHAGEDESIAQLVASLDDCAGDFDDDATLEKCMAEFESTRTQIAKSENLSGAEREQLLKRVATASKDTQDAIMRRRSPGYVKAQANRAAEAKQREMNMAGRT